MGSPAPNHRFLPSLRIMTIVPGKYRITTALDRERAIGVDPRTNDAHKRVIVVPKDFPIQASLWRVDRTEEEGIYLLSVLGADAVDTDAKVYANYGVDTQRWRISLNSHPDGYFIQRVDNNLTWFLPEATDFTQVELKEHQIGIGNKFLFHFERFVGE
ncbi:hypothetical protein EV401DRAFT_2209259 [Pisolithus croceorrhizus]|nr:hypothetical protein EV401DRAFT_2209259 [Pisolithus croceorrhizus]